MSDGAEQLPYGTWPSPITGDVLVQAAVGLGGPALSGGDVWWSELRPSEGGRVQIVRKRAHDEPEGLLPEGFSARTRAHEYGGGAWWLHGETIFFANWADQRLYSLDPGGEPVPLTPEPATPGADRYADGRVTKDARWVVCVRERHGSDGSVVNELVGILAEPEEGPGEPVVLRSGPDFVSNPRLSNDDEMICWLEWNLPRMPWEGSELWVAGLDTVGDELSLSQPEQVMGGAEESLAQPRWNPTGELNVISDADGWWNLWSFPRPGRPTPGTARQITTVPGELAEPQWVFGQSDWCVTPAGHLVGCWRFDGVDHLGVMRRDTWGEVEWVPAPFTSIDGLCAGDGSEVAFLAASFTSEPQVVTVDADLLSAEREPPLTVHRSPRDLGIGQEWFSEPEPLTFPTGTTGDAVAHGLLYPPRNPDVDASPDALPPLLVLSHGGPTASARPMLNLAVQYWTTRGWAVVDVNYRGSTGYGRDYRQLLAGQWGVVDVEDCAAAARTLAEQGRVDPRRLAIKGGSAGGFTTLAALTFHDVFAAGSSHYGVADLELLAQDTHKFESRYLDSLVGPYPEEQQRYRDRSPINHVDELSCPLVVLQGAEDEIVPPNQAERIVDAVRKKGLPVGYLLFEGEQHGFRRAETIKQAIEAERYFFSRVLAFDGAAAADEGDDTGAPVTIENLE